MSAAEIWVAAGLLLGLAELLAPGVFLLPVGLAACGAGAATALFGLGWHWQVAAFVALALVLVAATAARLRGRPRGDAVNAPTAGLIGGSCTAVAFRGGEGRVRLRDGEWQARVADGAGEPAPGTMLRVVGLDGTTLLVAAAR